MKAVSIKTAARNRRYAREREVFLAEHPLCEIGWDVRCTGASTEVHHMAGRFPSVFFDQALWLAGCHHCHQQATDHPTAAFERGVSVHRHGGEAA
jgi:hypothetical protein